MYGPWREQILHIPPDGAIEQGADPTIHLQGSLDFVSLKSIIYFLSKMGPLSIWGMNFLITVTTKSLNYSKISDVIIYSEPPMHILCLLVSNLDVTRFHLGNFHVIWNCKYLISFSTSDDWHLVMKQICKVFPGVK